MSDVPAGARVPPGDRPLPGTAPVLNIANVLTGVRLVLVPFFVAALFRYDGTDPDWRLIAFGLFAVAAITDRLDGEIARRRGLVTPFGEIADPIADKALTGSALIGLSLLDIVPWWITVVILGRELGVTLLRFWVLRHGVIPASRGGKAKTFVQTVAIGLYVLPLPQLAPAVSEAMAGFQLVLLLLALVLTVVTGLDYVFRALRLRAAALGRNVT
ncbi:MAG: CDP-diacylglycerol--glycerol-3-phosphate 3-phosphatidyltransferase [Pseudonocardia sp.]|nr:CDP-diacylglycerol--glycerol-3-phosphate 3-phosphatidyltransferase [Pseudonocardia sp.]